jgi:DNA-binding NarL/FixJ family response regulator
MQSSGRSTDPSRTPLADDSARRRLTPRELAIAILVANGLKDIVIARRLGLSHSTVRTYVRNIRFRLGLNNRAEIIAWVAARYTPDHPEAGLHRGPNTVTPA